MREKFIISIPLIASDEVTYNEKWDKKIQRQLDSLPIWKNDVGTSNLVKQHLTRQNPHCYPYNAIVGFVEIYVDTMYIRPRYILNGDGRKVFNRDDCKVLRPKPKKFYNTGSHQAIGFFYKLTTIEITDAVIEALEGISQQCKEWKITFDLEYYKHLLTSIDYERFLN